MPVVVRRAASYIFLLSFLAICFLSACFGQTAENGKPATGNPEQRERDNPAARQAWFLKGRTVPGKNAAALLHRAFQQKLALRRAQQQKASARRAQTQSTGTLSTSGTVAASSLPVSGPAWSPIGPAPITGMTPVGGSPIIGDASGRITAIAVDPNDSSSNTVYVGGAYGGVWKTINGINNPATGVSWAALYDTSPAADTLSVGAIAVQPGNSNVILVGTGEPNNALDSYYGQGILRSADAGGTWSLITTAGGGQFPIDLRGMGFSKIAFSTANTSLVVAAAAGTSAPAGLNGLSGLDSNDSVRGLYYSTDSGQTWTHAQILDPGNVAICGGVGCSATDVVFDASTSTFYAAVRFHGLYSSTDGATWTRLFDSGLSISGNCPSTVVLDANGDPTCPMYRGQLAVQPSTGELYVVYISFTTDTNTQAPSPFTPVIARANFGAANWTPLATGGISNCGDPKPPSNPSGGCGTGQQGFYDLYIAAVPNGANTDLYFGAVNLFKCSISPGQTCNATSGTSNIWLNTTHVYGNCATTYHSMHPDNHALSFNSGNAGVLYFGNDGGVYRTLTETNLTGGTTCSGNGNTFDDLNTSSLGSLTQFIAISTHPTDASVTLGGTQDNGSPAIAAGQSSPALNPPLWFEANGGDGGFNIIDGTGTIWYTANTDVSIWKCSSGTDCIENATFGNAPIITNTQVGGDHGAFYTPYILDPNNQANIIVGTCRVWRGPNTSLGWSSANVLSFNFDTGTATACTGNEFNTVHSLAAGGPAINTLSQVIYAGTDDGSIFVTTNAAGGPNSWFDATNNGPNGSINVGHFPISSVAMDPTPALAGQTAYVTVMGFTGGARHVWKTTNAGASWTDITGNLPDAPANSVLIDPGNHNILYVGTDVGVFMTDNGGASWVEYGTGFPNVAVVSLAGAPLVGPTTLRAGTHGRGVFEIPLASTANYSLSISDAPQTIYPGQTATFHGTATAIGNYHSAVNLSCTGSFPATCTPAPSTLTPLPTGTAFTLQAGGIVGDFFFDLQGTGTDSATTINTTPVALHVTDFSVKPVAPNPVSVPHGATGGTGSFSVVPATSSFADSVHLDCNGQPAGVTCGFSNNDFVPAFNFGFGQSVTLTIAAPYSVPLGSQTLNLTGTGSSLGAPTKTIAVPFTVTLNPDVVLSGSPIATRVQQTMQGPALITYEDGITGTVNLACFTSSVQSCSVSPTSVTTTSPLTMTVVPGAIPAGNYQIQLSATGTTIIGHILNIPVAVWDYSVLAPANATAASGDTTNVVFTLHPLNGSQQNVDASCSLGSGLTGATCSIVGGTNPISLAGGDVGLSVAITLPLDTISCSANCTLTIHTTDNDVPATPAHDATVNIAISPRLGFIPVTPCRVADTRNPAGPFGGPFLSANTSREFDVPNSSCGIPNTAVAYSVNLTVIPRGPLGFLTAYPCGQAVPLASNLNSVNGQVRAVAAIVPAGSNGGLCAFPSNDTDLVIDINGYFVLDSNFAALAFYPLAPCRLVDTRLANGTFGGPSLVANATRTFPVLSGSCGVPNTAQAYSLNYTVVPKGPLGFLSTWPAGQAPPAVSTLNAVTGKVTANAAIVPAGASGAISVLASNATDLIIDLNGYFAPMSTGGLSFQAVSPCRAVDTRLASGPLGGPSLSANTTRSFPILSSPCGVPGTAQAFAMNATVVPPGPLGFLTLWPQGTAQPQASTLNAVDGQVTANLALVGTTNGSVSAFPSDPTHLILDVSGFFVPTESYVLAISNTPQTVYPGNTATFNGTATGVGGFSSAVTLSCAAGATAAPATCTPGPSPVTPTGAGAGFTVSASDSTPADYNFDLAGTVGSTTSDLPVTLRVVDFALSATPTTVNVQQTASERVTLTVTAEGAAGAFTDTVHLACSSLATGMACTFSQNDFVPTPGGTPVTVIINSGSALPGTTTIHLDGTGSSAGAPTHTQDVTVTVNTGPTALGFIPVTPCRVVDTRLPNGPLAGPFLSANTSREFDIPGSCGIPNTGAVAYSVNLTAVPRGPLGFLTAYPCGQAVPQVSNLNSIDGRVKAVAAIVPAGANGGLCIFPSNDTDLVIDINGYFVPKNTPNALAFYPLTPCRLVDTRQATGTFGGPSLAANTARSFPLQTSTSCSIPSTAVAYSLNYTAAPKGPLGFLSTWPEDQAQPTVSTLNAVTGTVTANAAIVPAAATPGGAVSVLASDATDLIIDINGYFAPPNTGGLSLYTLAPCRVLDTRNPPGSPPFSGQKDIDVVGSGCGAPTTAQAFVLNATVVPPGPLGFLTLWPQGTAQPLVSTLNAIDGAVTSNLAIVPTTNGSISTFASNPTHLVVDISAFFAP